MRWIFMIMISLYVATCSNQGPDNQTRLLNEPVSNTVADRADVARYYKETPHGKLEMHLFFPEGYDPGRPNPYPAVANFCGGAWVEAKMEWAQGNARYMADQGFIGVGFQYRLADYKQVSVLDTMKDAASAVRWLRLHAAEFNIDPDKIIAMGDSAGGHLALSTAFFPEYSEPSEDSEISSVPNAIFTVAAAVNVNDGYFKKLLIGQGKPRNCSPYQNVRSGLPPIYMTHCIEDDILPFQYTEEFVNRLRKKGNTAELYPIPGGSHIETFDNPEIRSAWEEQFSETVRMLGWEL